MKLLSSLVFFVAACVPSFGQDDPITAKTSTITVVLKDKLNGNAPVLVCSFAAMSVKYNVDQTVGFGPGSIGGPIEGSAGKITFNPLSMVKPVDICSPTIFYRAAAGIVFDEVLVVIYPPASDSGQSTYAIRLGTAFVKDLTDAAADGRAIQEQVIFEFGDLTLAEIGPQGHIKSCHGWNRLTNVTDTSHCSELNGLPKPGSHL